MCFTGLRTLEIRFLVSLSKILNLPLIFLISFYTVIVLKRSQDLKILLFPNYFV